MVAALIADGFRNYLRAGHRKPAKELRYNPATDATFSGGSSKGHRSIINFVFLQE